MRARLRIEAAATLKMVPEYGATVTPRQSDVANVVATLVKQHSLSQLLNLCDERFAGCSEAGWWHMVQLHGFSCECVFHR